MTILSSSLLACSTPATEIIVTIDTAFGVPCTIDRIVVDVMTSAADPTSEEVVVTEDSLPGSLTLIASNAPGQLTVRVTGFIGTTVVAVAEERAVTFAEDTSKELRFLLDSKCTPGPCGAVSQGEFDALPAPAARIACGDERYNIRESLALLTNACTGDTEGTVMSAGDDELEMASPLDPQIPFPFFFYGKLVSTMWVGDNGYLSFSTDEPQATNGDLGDPRSLGESPFPAPSVLPFWDNLRVGQKVCFATQGNAPDRTLWVTWDRACFGPGVCGGPDEGTLTFSVGLEETTNSIHVGYQTMVATGGNAERADGLTAVVGVTSGGEPGCSASECGEEDNLCPGGGACGFSEYSARTTSLEPIPQIEFRPVSPAQ